MPHRQASLSSSISEDDYTEYILRSSHPVIRVTGVETDPEIIARRTRETFEITYRQHENVAAQITALTRKVDDTTKTLIDAITNLQTVMLSRFAAMDSKFASIDSKFSDMDGVIRSLSSEVSGLRTDTAKLQYAVTDIQARLDAPNTAVKITPPSVKSVEFTRPPRNSDSLDSLPKVNIEPADVAPDSSTALTTTSTIPLRTTKSSNSMRRIASLLRGVLGTAEKLADEDERRLPTNSL